MAKTTTKKKPAATKAKAKKEEVQQEVAVDYSRYDYRPSDNLQVKAEYIGKLRQAFQIAVQNGSKEHYPTVTGWVARDSGVPVENPTKEAIESKKVQPIMDLDGTFAQANLKITYEPWVAAMAEALEIINVVHQENVDLGNATPREELQKEAEALQAAQLKAQEEAKAEVGPQELTKA